MTWDIDSMSDTEAGKLFKACMNYNLWKEVGELPASLRYLFPLFIESFEKSFQSRQTACNQRYIANCKRRKKEVDETKLMNYKNIRSYTTAYARIRPFTDYEYEHDYDNDSIISSSTNVDNDKIDKKIKNKKIIYSSDFEKFWKVFPKKKWKQKAYEARTKCIKWGNDPNYIIQKAIDYATEVQLKHVEDTYIKRPQWRLNEGRYDDDFYVGKKEKKEIDLDDLY